MSGQHVSSDGRRFRRDLRRLILLSILWIVVVAGIVLVFLRLIGGSEGDGPSATTSATVAATTIAPQPEEPVATISRVEAPSTTAAPATAATTTATTLPPIREPDRVIVLVLNSTRVSGLAGRLSERLAGLGYRLEQPGNHPSPLDTSVVWYIEGYDREAAVLGEAIPDADVAPFPENDPKAPVTVVLGGSYRE